MQVEKTDIQDCFVIKPTVFGDDRGYFMESFNTTVFKEKTGINTVFVQDNQSFSSYGVIRGLHAQMGEFAQAKLVRVIKGEVFDVIVDARKESPTYGNKVTILLNEENKTQLFVPKGCLHGFSVLSESAVFFYKCDDYYDKASEIGVRYNDPFLGIDWGVEKHYQKISEKDLELPFFKDMKYN
jgi:dTDP-4-dehydrorhamnose 3,5-epimerase